jgi:hypothetical protein
MRHATFATEPSWGDGESDFGPADESMSDVSEEFTSRTGDVVYGHGPLLWFDEWDPEAGDVAEATPYGQILDECGNLRHPQSKNINDPGAAWGFPLAPPRAQSRTSSTRTRATTVGGLIVRM